MSEFVHCEELEIYSQLFKNATHKGYKAFVTKGDIGFVILQFPDRADLYEFNNGPYQFLGTYPTFDDAELTSYDFC